MLSSSSSLRKKAKANQPSSAIKAPKKTEDENVIYVYTYKPTDLTWRRIVFLPFNFYWRIFIATLGIIYSNLFLFEEVFLHGHYENHALHDVMILMSMLFFIDVVLSLLHRTWESVQKSMPYQPKSNLALALEIISIIPISIFFNKPLVDKNGAIYWPKVWALNSCLRMSRVYMELFKLQQRMGLNPLIVCLVQHNAIMLSLASLLCCVWYAIGYVYKDAPSSWLNDFEKINTSIDLTNPGMAYVVSFLQVLFFLNNRVVMDIKPMVHLEKVFFSTLLYVGYLMRYTYMMATMIASFLKTQQHMYIIKHHIDINKRCSDKKHHNAIEEYYVTYWNNWLGLRKCPRLHRYPVCLQKDILTDMYWEAIEHSHLLRYFTINVKRELGLNMRSKFMQPGDYIFRKGKVRSCFFYIASGVVQVMSHYDGVSPIITISAGSCLGCLALALPTPCPTDVICATECEVRFLAYPEYFSALAKHKDATRVSEDTLTKHLAHARLIYTVSKATTVENPVMKLYGVPQDDKLKWIKQRWRTIRDLGMIDVNVTEAYIRRLEETLLPIDVGHTSKYLDLLVLSSEVKWDADKCCYKTAFPYVLEPACHFIKAWHLFIVFMVTIDSIVVPYHEAYMSYTSEVILMWDQLTCIAYLIDVYFQIITANRSVDITITESAALLRHHLKKVSFIIDIFGTFPIRQLSRMVFDVELERSDYLGLHRLCKLVRVYTFFKYQYSLITTKVIISHVVKTVYLFFMVTHISACFAFIIACEFQEGQLVCEKNSWFDRYKSFPVSSVKQVYIYLCCSWVFVGDLLGICGMVVNVTTLFSDAVFISVVVFLARNILTFTISEFVAMWIMKRQRQLLFNDLTISLKSVLQQKRLHQGLTNMFTRCMQLQWHANFAVNLLPLHDVLSPITITHREKLLKAALKSVDFFTWLDDETVNRIVNHVERYIVPKGFIFCRSGERPTTFNIVLRGICCVTSMLKEDLLANPTGKMVGKGGSFPLLEILQNVPSFQTVVSVTITEVIAINAEKLKALLIADKELALHIRKATVGFPGEILKTGDVVMSKKRYTKADQLVPEFVPAIRTKVRRRPSGLQELKTPWQKFIYIINLVWSPPYMINPRGDYMHVWELLKIVQAIATVLYVPSMLLFMCDKHDSRYIIALALDAFSFVDIIVRFHLGVFNEDGVLINTRLYYLRHAFAVDLIASLPTYIILTELHFRAKFTITVFTKVLQLYRLSGYIFVLKHKIDLSDILLILVNFSLHFILVVYVMSTLLFCYTCDVTCNKGQNAVNCDRKSWVFSNKLYKNIDNPLNLFLASTYMSLAIMTGSDTGPFRPQMLKEVKGLLLCTILACVAKCYYLPNATAHLIGNNSGFKKYRENKKKFQHFIKNEGGDTKIVSEITDHFTYSYMRLKGVDMQNVFHSLHPSLVSDLSFAMYYKGTRCLHQFVGASTSFMRILSLEVQEIYFLKGATVIDINQVNENIYFVCEGTISVFNGKDETIMLLRPGSMFGSFKPIGKTRHKFRYVNLLNVCLLEIRAAKFMDIFRIYNKHAAAVFLKLTGRREYIITKQLDKEIGFDVEVTTIKPTIKPPGIFYKNSSIYQYLMFVLSMVVPYLTVFPLLFSIVFSEFITVYVTVLYILDLIMCSRVIIGLNSTYTDRQTGVYVSDMKQIRSVYLTKPSQFTLDILSLFPFEVIWYILSGNWVHALRINRILRILMIFVHVYKHRDTSYVRLWMRWFGLVSYVTLSPFIVVMIWLYFACDSDCKSEMSGTTSDRVKVFTEAVHMVIVMMTSSSTHTFYLPTTGINCFILICVVSVSYILCPFIIASFVQKLDMANYSLWAYEYKLYCVMLYLQLRDLSNSLLRLLWNYSLLLWTTNDGEYLPEFLIEAPPFLKCQLMYDLYGGHISYNVLFDDCQHAFVFQLTGRLKRTVYFPGDVIVRKFDVDGCMYFINSGEVEAVEYDDLNTEVVEDVFITGQCFGLAQGLEERLPHAITYKARNTVELLSLEHSNFMDLLEAFPDDMKKINNKVNKIELMIDV